jgi:hypothetical protein
MGAHDGRHVQTGVPMAVSSPLAVARDVAISPISARLEAARRSVEGRFLQAGEVLGQAVEGVGRLIGSLDQLTKTVQADAVEATTAELRAAAASLLTLPAQHAARRAVVERLTGVGDALAACIEDMRRNLAYLRVYAINIKITAGGVAAAGAEFGMFAQEICDRIALGRTQLAAFDTELTALREELAVAVRHEKDLTQHCVGLLPAVPDGLTTSADEMIAHCERVSRVALEVAGLARDVQKKVGKALAALQIGDITRQRIEHVQQALDLLAQVPDLASEPRGRLEAFVHGLLAAQLRATAEDFHRDVASIGQSMSGMAADAAEILRLRDLAFGRAGGGDSFLKRMETNVSHALDMVGRLEQADLAATGVGRSAAAAAADLSSRITGLQAIKTDVQQMALNTTLKCTRIGETGKPLAVIAVELRLHAGHMETSAQIALTSLDDLTLAAGALGGEPDDGAAAQVGAGAALSDAAARLHAAGETVEADLADLARQGEAVVKGLRAAAARLDFQREIGAILDEAAESLFEQAGDETPWTDDLREPLGALLAKIAKDYTMATEREIHRYHTDGLDLAAEPPAAAEPVAADEDDVLF